MLVKHRNPAERSGTKHQGSNGLVASAAEVGGVSIATKVRGGALLDGALLLKHIVWLFKHRALLKRGAQHRPKDPNV